MSDQFEELERILGGKLESWKEQMPELFQELMV